MTLLPVSVLALQERPHPTENILTTDAHLTHMSSVICAHIRAPAEDPDIPTTQASQLPSKHPMAP